MMGFNLELLASRESNLKVLRQLDWAKIEEVKRIIMREFIAEKFRHPSLESKIREGNLEAMAEALQGVRLNTTYLLWKNPRFRGYPDAEIIRASSRD